MQTRHDRAVAARAEVIRRCGGHCADCPATENLELDYLGGDGAHHHNLGWCARQEWYLQQSLLGLIEVRCYACHRRVSAARLKQKRFTRLRKSSFPLQGPNF